MKEAIKRGLKGGKKIGDHDESEELMGLVGGGEETLLSEKIQLLDYYIFVLVLLGNVLFFFEHNLEFDYTQDDNDMIYVMLWTGLGLSVLCALLLVIKALLELQLEKGLNILEADSNLFTSGKVYPLLGSLLLLLVHPYPFLVNEGFLVFNQIVAQKIYYNWNDLLQITAMMRILWFGIKLLNMTLWRNKSSQRIW